MSFILDALKKSENDRQRQSGPALFEVRVPPPRSRFPLLAVVIVSLLVVNLAVVAWIMLRKPAEAAPASAQTAPSGPSPAQQALGAQQVPPSAQTVAPQMTAPGGALPPPPNTAPQYAGGAGPNAAGYAQYPAAPGANGYPNAANNGYPNAANNGYPPPNGGYGPANTNGGYPPGAGSNGYPPAAGNNSGYPPPNAGAYNRAAGEEPMLSDGAQQIAQGANPDDYEPAHDAGPPGAGAGRVTRSTDSGLPTYEEAATHASIPPLHMDLHSYAPEPSKRFVLINMRRLYEGQALPEGPKVETITSDAAIMSYQGTRFVLDKD